MYLEISPPEILDKLSRSFRKETMAGAGFSPILRRRDLDAKDEEQSDDDGETAENHRQQKLLAASVIYAQLDRIRLSYRERILVVLLLLFFANFYLGQGLNEVTGWFLQQGRQGSAVVDQLLIPWSDFADTSPNPTPYALRRPQSCAINHNLTHFLTREIELGWPEEYTASNHPNAPQGWLKELCPEVFDYFDEFPMYKYMPKYQNKTILPFQDTMYAAHAVCTAKIVHLLAASIDARVYLYAGSHLGALLQGQPFPWDDDVDMALDFAKKQEFLDACEQFGRERPLLNHPRQVMLFCATDENISLKVWLEFFGQKKLNAKHKKHMAPFVDLFYLNFTENRVLQVHPNGRFYSQAYSNTDFFPSRPYSFGGITTMGPNPNSATSRWNLYNFSCLMGDWNHRLGALQRLEKNATCIDCYELSKLFPFANATVTSITGNETGRSRKIFPQDVSQERPLIRQLPNETSLKATERFLQTVQSDNTISSLKECSSTANKRSLQVIQFDLSRAGLSWFEMLDLLSGVDVLLLSGVDIGMTRSNQQHIAQLLANGLEMNFAWGPERIVEESSSTSNLNRKEYRAQGMAILSKCKLHNLTIVRDGSEPGSEKEFRSNMMLLARVDVDGTSIAVGSGRQLQEGNSVDIQRVKEYIRRSPTIISSDDNEAFAQHLGMKSMFSPTTNKDIDFSACPPIGRTTSISKMMLMHTMQELGDAIMTAPCKDFHGIKLSFGTQPMISAGFEIP